MPLAAGLLSEAADYLLTASLTRRREAWANSVSSRLEAIENLMDALKDDGIFTSTLVEATLAAMKTHQQEKLDLLANAVANSATTSLEEDLALTFVRYVSELTPSHIEVLKKLREPVDAPDRNDRCIREPHLVRRLFPNVDERQEWFQALTTDLVNRGLVRDSSSLRITADGATSRPDVVDFLGHANITGLGLAFLRFVLQH